MYTSESVEKLDKSRKVIAPEVWQNEYLQTLEAIIMLIDGVLLLLATSVEVRSG